MRLRIPILVKIANLAKKYAASDAELAYQLNELELCYKEEDERHQEALEARGANCITCNKRFVPLPDDSGIFCSIGCRWKDI